MRTNVVRNHNRWKDRGILHHDHATHQIEDYSWANNCFLNFILEPTILAVSPTNTDFSNSDALQMARIADPNGKYISLEFL